MGLEITLVPLTFSNRQWHGLPHSICNTFLPFNTNSIILCTSQLKITFPCIELSMPRKRWFGDNFNPGFIEERSRGLQFFVDGVLCRPALHLCPNVREFFCLDEPPCAGDSIDESRVRLAEQIKRIIRYVHFSLSTLSFNHMQFFALVNSLS